jgi:hypothetical protein
LINPFCAKVSRPDVTRPVDAAKDLDRFIFWGDFIAIGSPPRQLSGRAQGGWVVRNAFAVG